MPDVKQRGGFAEVLAAQDPLPPGDLARRRDKILNSIRRRILMEKAVTGTAYVLLFTLAFAAYMKNDYSRETARAIAWSTLSTHMLVWFLAYFLWRVERMAVRIVYGEAGHPEALRRRSSDRTVAASALAVFVVSSVMTGLLFTIGDPLRVSKLAASVRWLPVFYVFWYPFGTMSLLAKLRLDVARLEIASRMLEEKGPAADGK